MPEHRASADFLAMAEAFDGLVYITSPSYELEFSNSAGRERAGADPVGRKCYQALYKRTEVCPWCRCEQVLKGQTIRQEFQQPAGGAWWSAVASLIRRPEGGRSSLWMVRDVSEDRQTRARLSQRDSELQTVLRAYPDLYFWMDRSGTIQSHHADRTSDSFIPPEQFIGRRMQDVLPPDVAGLIKKAIDQVNEEESLVCIEYSLPLKDGEKSFEARLLPLGEGQLLAVVRDISVRRLAELALRESEARYRAIVEDQTELICRFLPDGRLTFVNQAYIRYFAERRDVLAGRSVMPLMAPEHDEVVRKRLVGLSPREPVVTFDHSHSMPDGSTRWIQWTGRAIFDERQCAVEYQFAGTDITDRVTAEHQLKKSMNRLETMTDEIIDAMAFTVEMRDQYTAGHQRRVAQLACAIAAEMGLPEERSRGLHVAGRLHDIGKIHIPAEYLSKPSSLSGPESSIMRTHPGVSFDILRRIDFPWPVAQIALQHHELLNGSGYPAGLSGEGILLEARILAVADVVESMATNRPYRPSLGVDKALQQISLNRGILYDADAVDACIKVIQAGFALE